MTQGQQFSQWVREQMRVREWVQSDLAHAAKVSPSTINSYVLGRHRPGPATAAKLARALRVDHDEVLYQAGHVASVPAGSPLRRRAHTMIDRLDDRELGAAVAMLDGLLTAWGGEDADAGT